MSRSERNDGITTDLLAVWTDPDTAMEAIGRGLELFDERVASPVRILTTNSRLRNSLYNVLLSLVDGGILEMRPCGDGRHAFRWRDGNATALSPPSERPQGSVALTSRHQSSGRAPPPRDAVGARGPVNTSQSPTDERAAASPRAEQLPGSVRPIERAGLLVMPALACALLIVAFISLNHVIAIGAAAALTVVGLIGLIRRVPFAGAWVIGLTFACLVVHFS